MTWEGLRRAAREVPPRAPWRAPPHACGAAGTRLARDMAREGGLGRGGGDAWRGAWGFLDSLDSLGLQPEERVADVALAEVRAVRSVAVVHALEACARSGEGFQDLWRAGAGAPVSSMRSICLVMTLWFVSLWRPSLA
jgi:hypothetical protein